LNFVLPVRLPAAQKTHFELFLGLFSDRAYGNSLKGGPDLWIRFRCRRRKSKASRCSMPHPPSPQERIREHEASGKTRGHRSRGHRPRGRPASISEVSGIVMSVKASKVRLIHRGGRKSFYVELVSAASEPDGDYSCVGGFQDKHILQLRLGALHNEGIRNELWEQCYKKISVARSFV
jgi:hypothetical protein